MKHIVRIGPSTKPRQRAAIAREAIIISITLHRLLPLLCTLMENITNMTTFPKVDPTQAITTRITRRVIGNSLVSSTGM